jgi:hypothetical protein
MADTLGMLVEKIFTAQQKMWVAQEDIYEVRRMSFEEFKVKYIDQEEGAKKLWEVLKRACDLNIQRNAVIDEFDERVIEMIRAAVDGEDLDNGKFVQRKHKTY